MSTLKVNNLQVGQDSTATNNLTWFQPGSPDGTIRLGSGNAGSATTKFTFDKDGNLTCVGDITANSIIAPIEGTLDDWIVHAGDTNTKFGYPAVDTFSVETAGTEALRIDSNQRVMIGSNTSGGWKFRVQVAANASYQSAFNITNNVNADINFEIKNSESRIGPSTNTPLVFKTNNAERFTINSGGRVNIANGNQTGSHLDYTRLNVYGQTSHAGADKNLNLLNVYNYGSGNVGDITGIGLGCGASPGGYTKASIGFIRTGTYGRGDLIFCINDQGNGNQVVEANERLRIQKDGKVGMGITSTSGGICDPDGNALLIRAATTFQTTKGHIMLTGDGATVGEGPQIVFSESGSGGNFAGAYIGHVRAGGNSVGHLVFGTREASGDANTVPTERLRIYSDGRVSIGNNPTVDSNCQLHVEKASGEASVWIEGNTGGAGAYLLLRNNSTSSNPKTYIGGVDAGGQGTSQIEFHNLDNGTNEGAMSLHTRPASGSMAERVRIDSTGRVGINGDALKGMLEVRVSGGDPAQLTAVFGANEGTTAGTLTDNADKACRIGVQHYDIDTKPFTFLVGSGTSAANTLNIGGGTSLMNGATDVILSTDTGTINNGGTKRVQVTSDGTLHKYLNSSTIQASFGGSGQVNGIAGLPSSAGTPFVVGRDTGTNRSAHFGGHLQFASGYGINFQATGTGSGTVTSHVLDDYEEGTWNPTITNASGTDCGTYSWRTGEYTKIGNICYVTFALGLGGLTAASAYKLRGLPFTLTGFNYFYYIQAYGYNWNSGIGDSGSDTCIFLECNSGSNNQLNIVQGSGKGNASNTQIANSQRLSGMFWFYTA